MYLLPEMILATLLLGTTIAVSAFANSPSARRAKSKGAGVNAVTGV